MRQKGQTEKKKMVNESCVQGIHPFVWLFQNEWKNNGREDE